MVYGTPSVRPAPSRTLHRSTGTGRPHLLQAELVTRHPTEYNIKVLRFSAYQVGQKPAYPCAACGAVFSGVLNP